MASFLDKFKINGSKLETPLTVRQVESHLVFGPLSRHFSVAYLAALCGALQLVHDFLNHAVPPGQRIGSMLDDLLIWVVVMPFILSRMTRRQQAILAWGATKFTLALTTFIMVTVGGGKAFSEGDTRDGVVFLLLGLLWFPSIEFIPTVTPHQKYVTLVRLILSIPLVIIGIRGGNWHWS